MLKFNFLLGFLINFVGCFFYYVKDFKLSNYYLPAVLTIAVLSTATWAHLVRTSDNKSVLIYGFYWDLMITLIYLLVPIVFFSVKLTFNQSLGIGFTLLGLILMKV